MTLPRLTRSVRYALLFVIGYLVAAVVGAWLTGNGEFVFYVLVMVALIGVVLLVYSRVPLSSGLIWCLAIWGASHMAGGLLRPPSSWPVAGGQVLYNLWIVEGWLKYDQLTHAFGFGAACWLCWQALKGAVRGPVAPTPGLLSLCALAACGLGAINEVVEFVATLIGPSNVGGYRNTALDLVFNLLGAGLAAVLIGWHERSGRASSGRRVRR